MNMTTPALLFPAITLLLLAYTNRFNTLAGLVRHLYHDYCAHPHPAVRRQITFLQRRIKLIKEMQLLSVSSFFLCVLCMLLLFFGEAGMAMAFFALSLLFLLGSLGISIWEIHLSAAALDIQLADLDRDHSDRPRYGRPDSSTDSGPLT